LPDSNWIPDAATTTTSLSPPPWQTSNDDIISARTEELNNGYGWWLVDRSTVSAL